MSAQTVRTRSGFRTIVRAWAARSASSSRSSSESRSSSAIALKASSRAVLSMWKSTRRGSTWIGTEEPSAIERSIEYRLSTQPLSLGSPKSLKVLRSASEIGVPTGAQFFGLTARRRGGGAGGTFGRRRRGHRRERPGRRRRRGPRGRRGGGHPTPRAPVSRPPPAGAGALRRGGVRRDRAGGGAGNGAAGAVAEPGGADRADGRPGAGAPVRRQRQPGGGGAQQHRRDAAVAGAGRRTHLPGGAPGGRRGRANDAPAAGDPDVIGKVCQRGQRVSGLLHYLYAAGPAQQEGRNRRNPHVDPRLVGGFDDPAELE